MKRAVRRITMCSLFALILAAAASSLPAQSSTASDTWFRVTQVADKVWAIDDHGNDKMYLIEGQAKALLVDTGLGVGDLTACVQSITRLPVVVVNTHGHTDHAGGNYPFKTVYANPMDFDGIRQFGNREYRLKMAQNMLKGSPITDPVLSANHEVLPPPVLVEVKDGYVFDLGGRKLEVIEVPGHTPGSICILDAAHKLLFAGDNDNQLVWLFLSNSTPLEIYLQSLQKLNKRVAEFDTIMPGHGAPLKSDFVAEQIACAQSILDGSCSERPYKSFAGNAMMCSYKSASIAFDPKNLRVRK